MAVNIVALHFFLELVHFNYQYEIRKTGFLKQPRSLT